MSSSLKKSFISYVLVAGFMIGIFGLATAGILLFGSPDKRQYVGGALCGGTGLLMMFGFGFGIYREIKKSLLEMEVIASNVSGQPLLYGQGWYRKGKTHGTGIVIFRPGFVTFLVLGKLHTPLGTLADIAVAGVTGYRSVANTDPSQIMTWIETLRTKHAGKFDELVLNGAAERGGLTWPVTEMTTDYDAITQQPKKWISCRSGNALIGFTRMLCEEKQKVAEAMVVAMERERTNPSPPPEPSIFLEE
jgi:hypothetical protein